MRLLELSIHNFRGFGPNPPPIRLDGDLILFFGPNGFGKTSLAEAIEWLFYGTTKRRQRGETYSRSEYAGCYENVHGGKPVEVEALVSLDGNEFRLSRRLMERRQKPFCRSTNWRGRMFLGSIHKLWYYWNDINQHCLVKYRFPCGRSFSGLPFELGIEPFGFRHWIIFYRSTF